MSEEKRSMLAYRVLRYGPNLVRNEWVNIGIVLEDTEKQRAKVRVIEDESEMVRIRRLHPDADEKILRVLPGFFQSELAATGASGAWIARIDQSFSNSVRLSAPMAIMTVDFDAELERLYQKHVSVPARAGRGDGILENTRAWIRMKLSDVFRRHRILSRMERGVRAEQFTQKGDPLRIDFGYRYNGTRGFVQALSLGRDPAQAKVLAYTAERIRARQSSSEFTAITEVAPVAENPRHEFVVRLFDEQRIAVVPLPQVEMFAERLRLRLQ